MKAQTFLEQFRHRGADSPEFFYGMNHVEPYSPFLFMRQRPGNPDFGNSIFEIPGISLPGLDITPPDDFLKQHEQLDYMNSVRKMLFCAAETHTRRISTRRCQCTLCGRKFDMSDRFQHMVTRHLNVLPGVLENHAELLNQDNEEDMNAFIMKLAFEPMMKKPTKPRTVQRKAAGTIVAPVISPVIEKETPEELRQSEAKRPLGVVEVRLNGVFAPGLIKFVTRNMTQPAPLVFDPEMDGRFDAAEKITEELFEKTYMNPTLFEAKKEPPEPVQPEPKPVKREAPQNQRGPSPKSQPAKQGNAKQNHQAKQPPAARQIPDVDIDALDFETGTSTKGSQKKGKVRLVSFIEQVPEGVRDEVIRNLTNSFLQTYVKVQCHKVTRGILQTKKKQMREEQRWKVKQQRETEKRNRKQSVVDRLSEDMCNSLIRSFIRQEICDMYEEAAAEAREEVDLPIDETNDGIPPVIVSGLPHYRYPTSAAIYDVFRSYHVALDEDGCPKIRYRFNGSRYDVLLYLSSRHDVNRLLSQRAIQIEYATVKLSVDDPDAKTNDADLMSSYTGQEIRITPAVKNLEDVVKANRRHLFGFDCPVLCTDTFTPQT